MTLFQNTNKVFVTFQQTQGHPQNQKLTFHAMGGLPQANMWDVVKLKALDFFQKEKVVLLTQNHTKVIAEQHIWRVSLQEWLGCEVPTRSSHAVIQLVALYRSVVSRHFHRLALKSPEIKTSLFELCHEKILNFKPLANFCCCTPWFMSQDRFSHTAAHLTSKAIKVAVKQNAHGTNNVTLVIIYNYRKLFKWFMGLKPLR